MMLFASPERYSSSGTETHTMALKALFAVYGCLAGNDNDSTKAAIVTSQLQDQFSNHPNGVVTISNANLGGDPAPGVKKHFGAIVEVDGTQTPFACDEGQTIDFS
jgi:hypothetical protein